MDQLSKNAGDQAFPNLYLDDPTSPKRLAAGKFIAGAVGRAAEITAALEPGSYWNGFATKDTLPDKGTPLRSPRGSTGVVEPRPRVSPNDRLEMRGLARAFQLSRNPETKAQIERDLRTAIDRNFGPENAA